MNKQKIKKIIVILFLFIGSLSLTSCWNDKNTDSNKTDSNVVSDMKNKKEIKKTNYKDLTKKENESWRFQKVEKGSEVTTVETKIWNDSIGENVNISPNGWGTVKGWLNTWADPLKLQK
jgi:hypothetical protein